MGSWGTWATQNANRDHFGDSSLSPPKPIPAPPPPADLASEEMTKKRKMSLLTSSLGQGQRSTLLAGTRPAPKTTLGG